MSFAASIKTSLRPQKIKAAYMGCFIFSMAANAFAYFNFYPQHDALNHVMKFAREWEVSLGRFLLPIYGQIRGDLTSPWVIGILSILFLGGSTYLISEILNIDSLVGVFLIGGLLSANITVTEMCSVFMYVEDAYMLSFFLACLAVYILTCTCETRLFLRLIIAVCCIVISLGLYQAYITIAVALFAFLIGKDTLNKDIDHSTFLKWILYVISLVIGLGIYFVLYKAILSFTGISPANSYNSVENLNSLQLENIISYSKIAYTNFGKFFWGIKTDLGFTFALCNVVLTLLAVGALIHWLAKEKLSAKNILILLLIGISYPGICMAMGILMGKKSIYFLTSYAIFLIYPVYVSAIEKYGKKLSLHVIASGCAFIILFLNIIYSNGAYVYQKILYDRSMVVMTKVLGDITETENYILAETPVVLIGSFYSIPIENIEEIDEIDNKYKALSAFSKISITYNQTFQSMCNLLGYPIILESDSEIIEEYQNEKVVQTMPAYPQAGYCQIVDGHLIIKISE